MEQRSADLVRGGLSPHEAERRARLELGFRETYKEQCRQSFGLRWFDELRQDLHYHLRVLRRNPGIMAIPILSLSLGIGVSTVVFSVSRPALRFRLLPTPSTARVRL